MHRIATVTAVLAATLAPALSASAQDVIKIAAGAQLTDPLVKRSREDYSHCKDPGTWICLVFAAAVTLLLWWFLPCRNTAISLGG